MPRGKVTDPSTDRRLRANRNGRATAVADFSLPADELDAALERLHREDEAPPPRDGILVEGQPWTRVAEVSLEDIPPRNSAPGKFETLWREVELRLEATSVLHAISYYFPDHIVGKTARESVARYAQRAHGPGWLATRSAREDDGGRTVWFWRGPAYPHAKRTRQARVDNPRKFHGMDDFEE